MLRIVVSIMVLIISLFGSEKFTDQDMKKYSELILNNKQEVYTPPELVKAIFAIKQRGEFETKVKYQERISKLIGNGVFFVFKKLDTKYDIDKNELEFMDIEIGSSLIIRKMLYAEGKIKKQGFSQVDYRLNNKSHQPFPLKNKIINTMEDGRFDFGKNGNYSVFLKIPPKSAKKLKNNENSFYQIIAIKIDDQSIQNRKIKDISFRYNGIMLYRLAFEVEAEIKGISVVSINPQKIIFAFGIDK